MSTAKVFKSGNSQAVRLPKQFRFRAKQVDIFRRGEEVVLRERRVNAGQRLSELFRDLPPMPADFFAAVRKDPSPEDRGPF
ncbi:MAG TPA: type II toxin-antitoxin system VapB family antitoxin [Gammaproteobacteria bacterium]|nr:type II toxin-antitoxin system VapB family antitoxin [Gammaproteobacteria bacterium]